MQVISTGSFLAIVVAATLVIGLGLHQTWAFIPGAIMTVILGWTLAILPRQARAIGVDGVLEHHLPDHVLLGDAERLRLLGNLLVDQRRAHEAGADHVGAHACLAPSLATTLARPMRPCFAVTYGALSSEASFECTEPM